MLNKKQVMAKLSDHMDIGPENYSRGLVPFKQVGENTYRVRQTFFYTHGRSASDLVATIKQALAPQEILVINLGEVNRNWPKDSYWEATFKLMPDEAPAGGTPPGKSRKSSAAKAGGYNYLRYVNSALQFAAAAEMGAKNRYDAFMTNPKLEGEWVKAEYFGQIVDALKPFWDGPEMQRDWVTPLNQLASAVTTADANAEHLQRFTTQRENYIKQAADQEHRFYQTRFLLTEQLKVLKYIVADLEKAKMYLEKRSGKSRKAAKAGGENRAPRQQRPPPAPADLRGLLTVVARAAESENPVKALTWSIWQASWSDLVNRQPGLKQTAAYSEVNHVFAAVTASVAHPNLVQNLALYLRQAIREAVSRGLFTPDRKEQNQTKARKAENAGVRNLAQAGTRLEACGFSLLNLANSSTDPLNDRKVAEQIELAKKLIPICERLLGQVAVDPQHERVQGAQQSLAQAKQRLNVDSRAALRGLGAALFSGGSDIMQLTGELMGRKPKF